MRNLRVLYQLNDRIEVQRAVWEDPGSGPEIVDWLTVRAAVPARIQPERVEVDTDATPPTSTATYRDCSIITGDYAAFRLRATCSVWVVR